MASQIFVLDEFLDHIHRQNANITIQTTYSQILFLKAVSKIFHQDTSRKSLLNFIHFLKIIYYSLIKSIFEFFFTIF